MLCLIIIHPRYLSETGNRNATGNCFQRYIGIVAEKNKGGEKLPVEALMKHLGYEVSNAHRALTDCYLTYQLYQKLNEM